MRLGLRGRTVLLVLVALAPPTVITLVVALEERDEARRHVQGDVLDTTRLVAADVRRVIDAPEPSSTRSRATWPTARPGPLRAAAGAGAARHRLVRLRRRRRPDGRVHCGTTAEGFERPMDPVDVSSASWFRTVQRRGGFALGDLGARPALGHGGADREPLACPLRAPARRERPLRRPRPPPPRTGAPRSATRPAGTTFVVLDHRGTVVARVPQDERLIGRRLPARPLVETVLRERQGTAEAEGLDGVTRIHGFAPVGGRAGERLFIAAGRTTESVYADPNADLRRYLLLAGLGLGDGAGPELRSPPTCCSTAGAPRWWTPRGASVLAT